MRRLLEIAQLNWMKTLLLMLTIILASCRGNGSNITQQSIETTKEASTRLTSTRPHSLEPSVLEETILPSPTTTSPTASSPTSSPTATSTPTPHIPPETRLQRQCLALLPELPGNAASNGNLILDSQGDDQGVDNPDMFLLNMESWKIKPISHQGNFQHSHAVSPDRKLIAYENIKINAVDESRVELVIANGNGQRIKSLPRGKDWHSILGWLDNQHLIIRLLWSPSDDPAAQKAPSVLLSNPITMDQQTLLPDFQDMYDLRFFTTPFWPPWGGPIYDSTKMRVLYPKYFEPDKIFYTYAIWDLQEQKLIASLEQVFGGFVDSTQTPQWSLDGSYFIIEGYLEEQSKYELFLVGRDGGVEQLTNLYSFGEARVSGISWSPDGKFLAGWLKSNALIPGRPELAIIDIETRQVIDYCIQVHDYALIPPLWSPDGKQIVVADAYRPNLFHVIFVDPIRGFAASIVEDMNPVGWMLAP